MTQKEAEAKYKEYLDGHIGNVCEALKKLSELDIDFIKEHLEELRDIVKNHDKTKWEEPEWSAYLHHFYPTNDEEAMKSEEFENACRHHIKNNKHHWDYWVDEENNLQDDIDEDEYKLYCVERCCDWLAMANQHDEPPTEWYQNNREFIVMPDYGFDLVDSIFGVVPEDFKLSFNGTRGDNDGNDNAEELDEGDLYLNRDVVKSLGKRVKKSKTSNTIEIDTSMTNHDKQLGEELTVEDKKETLHNFVKEANSEDIGKIVQALCDLGYYANDRRRNGTAFIHNVIDNIYGKNKKDSNNIEIAICNVLRKDREEYLTEITAAQIIQKSKNQDPERVNRSRKVKSTYLGMSKFGILNFKTTSQSRNGHHYQTVEFKDMKYFEDIVKSGKEIMPNDVKEAIKKQDINVWCTDESFSYWAWGHLAYKNDFLYIDDRIPDLNKRIQAPTVNNVRLNGGSCKHVLSVLTYIVKPFVLLAIAQDMNKYLAGTGEDKMQKQNIATQNQYDQVAQWDWSDIEKYTGLDKFQIMRDISKTIQVVPSIDAGDVITDLVGEALPQENQGLKREIVDRVEELYQDEK